MMTETDITILGNVPLRSGMRSRVYYYKGNVFQPFGIAQSHKAGAESKIKKFVRDNRQMILDDRAKPDYKSLKQLMDEQDKLYGVIPDDGEADY